MYFLILQGNAPGAGFAGARRTLTGFGTVTYKPASVGERAGWQQAGRVLAPCYLTSSYDEKGFAGGGLWSWFGVFAVSWILDLVVVGLCWCGAICAVTADDDQIW
jgi:hypothetical protein